MSNRLGVTVRFNVEEQGNLRSLCQFYNKDPKDVLKLAFMLMVQSTDKLQHKLPKEGDPNESSSTDAIGNGGGNSDGGPGAINASSSTNDGSSAAVADTGTVRGEGDLADVEQTVE